MRAILRRDVFAWSLYDFANSAFTTLVVTFIFSAYFTQVVAEDPTSGTILWARAVFISALVIAIFTPLLGAMADSSGSKKLYLLGMTLLCVVFTAMLFFAEPGTTTRALIFFILANIGYEGSYVFYNAFLPEISTRDTIGRVSGVGQALGYAGGLICLLVALGLIRGWLPSEGHFAVRATNLLVAGWYALFAIPLFLIVREEKKESRPSLANATREGLHRLHQTWRHLPFYREAAKLLVARMIYNDGLVTIFSFAAIFTAATFGLDTEQLIVMGLVLNIFSGIGAWGLGFVNDWIGGKKTILITLVVLIAATFLGAFAPTMPIFWTAAILLGLMIGPNQAASRSLLATFIPSSKHGEFFGFFAFSGRLASILGPLAYGAVLSATGSHRQAMGSIALFFIIGLVLLLFVDEPRGIALAVEEEARLEKSEE